jgi:hypothetical protein
MSLFKNVTMPCPACGKEIEFEAVHSVNADRRPDLRDEILNGKFQSISCDMCQFSFRLDPEMTYLDIGRGQWIAVHPFGSIGKWETLEGQARTAFNRSYGPAAPAAARELGAGLKPRLTFGWGALREKIFIQSQGLNDIDLELTKIAVLNGSDAVPLTAKTELRLADVQGNILVMAWVVAEMGEVAEKLAVPRGLYDEISADQVGWKALRDELQDRLFVDMQRLMLPVA